MKGITAMVSEGTLKICDMISAAIIERTKKEEAEYYLPQIEQLTAQRAYLISLLAKHNIPFDLTSEPADS